MKIISRSGAVVAAIGVGLSLAVLPAGPAGAAGGTHVRCNDITALKNAITRANISGGRITLASHCTYTLSTLDNPDDGLPEITGNVTITGRDTTIRRSPDATQDFRIFHVAAGGKLTLNSLTVSGGRLADSSGGGILNSGGTVKLNRTVIKGNHAFAGGGIRNIGGQLNLDHSTVERNTTNELGGGGGITNSTGTVNLNRTLIKGNHAPGGGGIYNRARGQLNLDHSTVEGNTADGFGGGVHNSEGATMTMKGGALLRNRALNNGGGLDNSEGFDNVGGTASLDSVSVRGNTARVGGGIRNSGGSTLRLKSTTLSDNIAVSGAGLANNASTATLVRSLVTRNTAITAGGGILNENSGQVTLTSSRVIRNAPDNCSPVGSVVGCTNPTSTTASKTSRLPSASDHVTARM